MIKLLGAGLGILSLLSGNVSAGEVASRKGTLYLFFSERTAADPAAAEAAARFARGHPDQVILRPALLVEDWSLLRKVTEDSPLFQTVRQLGVQIQVYDEEALRLAAAWKIVRLPAVALVAQGRAHVVQGAGADFESLWRCAQ